MSATRFESKGCIHEAPPNRWYHTKGTPNTSTPLGPGTQKQAQQTLKSNPQQLASPSSDNVASSLAEPH